jgi:phosphatidylinositol alpha-mannosyltransferase
MHIAIVSPYSMSRPGGVQDHARELARALVRAGCGVTLFGPEMRGPDNRIEGVGTVSLGGAVSVPANGSIAPLGIDPRMLVRFDLGLDPADVLHLHEPFLPASLFALLRRPKGTRVVGTFHAAADRFWPYAVAKPLIRRLASRLDATTAASPEARKLIRTYVSVDPLVVPNGVDADAFAAAEPDEWAAELEETILFVGRPEPRKGFRTVLEAFTALDRDDAHLVWIPATADDVPPELRNGRIHALGPVTRQRLMSLHKAANVVCCASLGQESFGIVVLEALAGGSAVIATDIPGYRFAGGDAPLYVRPGDVQALSGALAHLLDDADERARVAARGPARAREFDWSRIAAEMMHVYEEVLS